MTYKETLEFLYSQLPMFQKVGASAYKPGLDTVRALSEAFGNPHLNLKRSIHVAGTNGKGSVSHTLAAILQSAGYKAGLFTSPHILDFRERIRVNGEMISETYVTDFVDKYLVKRLAVAPSFFELTTVMAFSYFAEMNVDVAVVEVGLGGRLDSTNILTPTLSVITNISLDHTSLLGDTAEEIAAEKAGIIKPGVPVVVGESGGAVRDVFRARTQSTSSPLLHADDSLELVEAAPTSDGWHYCSRSFGDFDGELAGWYQKANALTVLEAVKTLRGVSDLNVSAENVSEGFRNVCAMTGLMGRWMKLSEHPAVVCDTGHNPGGWQYLSRQLSAHKGLKRLVIGFVNDKDVSTVLGFLKRVENVEFYFTQPFTPRALPVDELQQKAASIGLTGRTFLSVTEAYEKALADVVDKSSEMIFVGGSTFVVSDLLISLQ